MKAVYFLLFFFYLSKGLSQTTTFFVAPVLTNEDYAVDQDSHMIIKNYDLQNNMLFLFLGGTNSEPSNYFGLSNFAASLGFDAISLSYPNNIPAAFYSNNADSLAFDKYRQEVCFGTPLQFLVQVDTLNSIHTRAYNLLEYLSSEYPSDNWEQYLNGESLNWEKIIVAGHSQGGGHAAYFAKQHPLERVLMFASPNDYSNHFSNSGHWIRQPGVTATERYFGYLSLYDEVVDFEKQFTNLEGLQLYPAYDSIEVDNSNFPFEESRVLYTTQNWEPFLFHNTPVFNNVKNREVWEYLLTTPITSSNEEVFEEDVTIQIYPNPTSNWLNINIHQQTTLSKYSIVDMQGIVTTGRLEKNTKVDLSTYENGVYFLCIGDRTYTIVKQN